jgi:hypothetical protein
MILDSEFRPRIGDRTITQFIFDTLVNNGYNSWDVNFVIIIKVIEELTIFYRKLNYGDRVHLIVLWFCAPEVEKQYITNLAVSESRVEWFRLNFKDLATRKIYEY